MNCQEQIQKIERDARNRVLANITQAEAQIRRVYDSACSTEHAVLLPLKECALHRFAEIRKLAVIAPSELPTPTPEGRRKSR